MTDIVERLRKRTGFRNDADAQEAANEIELLRKTLLAVDAALYVDENNGNWCLMRSFDAGIIDAALKSSGPDSGATVCDWPNCRCPERGLNCNADHPSHAV